MTTPHWHQDSQGTDLGRNRCRRPPRRLIVRIHPHPRPSPHPEPLEPHDPPRPLPVPVEQRRRQRPPDDVRMRLPGLRRELQIGLAGIRIPDRKLNPDRRRVAEHQRHRGAPFAKVTRQLVLERSRLDHLPQPRHHIAEVQILRGIPEDDRRKPSRPPRRSAAGRRATGRAAGGGDGRSSRRRGAAGGVSKASNAKARTGAGGGGPPPRRSGPAAAEGRGTTPRGGPGRADRIADEIRRTARPLWACARPTIARCRTSFARDYRCSSATTWSFAAI